VNVEDEADTNIGTAGGDDNMAPMVDDESEDEEHHDATQIDPEYDDAQPDAQAQVAVEMDLLYGTGLHEHGLQSGKPRDYGHLHAVLEETVLAQFKMKRGIKEFGEDCVNVVLKELLQLHDRSVLVPVHATTKTPSERYDALDYLMFLKQKRDGYMKGPGMC
jgi:hypothetical protein